MNLTTENMELCKSIVRKKKYNEENEKEKIILHSSQEY